jgi:hypothetical protein
MAEVWVPAVVDFPGPPRDDEYPYTTEIDWVHFYRWDDDSTYPCSPAPGCLPATDTDFSRNNAAESAPP